MTPSYTQRSADYSRRLHLDTHAQTSLPNAQMFEHSVSGTIVEVLSAVVLLSPDGYDTQSPAASRTHSCPTLSTWETLDLVVRCWSNQQDNVIGVRFVFVRAEPSVVPRGERRLESLCDLVLLECWFGRKGNTSHVVQPTWLPNEQFVASTSYHSRRERVHTQRRRGERM